MEEKVIYNTGIEDAPMVQPVRAAEIGNPTLCRNAGPAEKHNPPPLVDDLLKRFHVMRHPLALKSPCVYYTLSPRALQAPRLSAHK